MWSNLVPDLGKLGDQLGASLGEALQKATADVEKSIDNTLGIKAGQENKAVKPGSITTAQAAPVPSTTKRDGDPGASAPGTSAPAEATAAAASAPSGKPQKKVVKKIIRRVVKTNPDAAGAAGAGAAGPAGDDSLQPAPSDASTLDVGALATGASTPMQAQPSLDLISLQPGSSESPAPHVRGGPESSGAADEAQAGAQPGGGPDVAGNGMGATVDAAGSPGDAAAAAAAHAGRRSGSRRASSNGWGGDEELQIGDLSEQGSVAVAVARHTGDSSTDVGAAGRRASEQGGDSLAFSASGVVGLAGAAHANGNRSRGGSSGGAPAPHRARGLAAAHSEGHQGNAAGDARGGAEGSSSVLATLLGDRDVGSCGVEELRQLVQQLHGAVQERDGQLLRQARQISELQQVVAGLQERNEELALKSAKLSEADYESIRAEFEQRLAAAERKVYAVSKERDALRKGAEKLADYGALIKEKDDIIKQVMEEGEKLSKKQVELEGIIKRLRQQLGGLEGERDKLAGRLAAEEGAVAELKKAKAKLEKDLALAGEQAKADLESQREHFELLLQKAKSDQVDAEERARESASQGLARKLREAEARCEALAESCGELRDALDRQRQAADLREEMLKADLADLERRCQAAEVRHQDLAAKMPEATRPLLRQIEAMQAAAEAQSSAWAGAEAALHARINDAEGRAAAASERERLAVDRMQMLSAKVSGLEAGLVASRAEVRSLNEQLEAAAGAASTARDTAAAAKHQVEVLTERCKLLQQQVEQAEAAAEGLRESERNARSALEREVAHVRREYERRLADMEGELGAALKQADAANRGPEPPAMAAPGYRWVLVKEGEQPPGQVGGGAGGRQATASDHMSASGSTQDILTSLRTAGSVGLGHGGGSRVSVSGDSGGLHDLESLRAALRAKTGELAAAQQHVAELEATRDRLAEELVSGTAKVEAAAEAVAAKEQLQAEMEQLRARLTSALELVGERDEQVEELLADLADVKSMYKDQIEFMCQQLAELQEQRQHRPAAGAAAASGVVGNGDGSLHAGAGSHDRAGVSGGGDVKGDAAGDLGPKRASGLGPAGLAAGGGLR